VNLTEVSYWVKEYPKNLQVRNERLIHKKFISVNVPCEVSVVVKNTAGVKECGAQYQSILHLENNQNTKKSYLLQVQNVEAVADKCKFSAEIKTFCAEIKLLFEWPV
jgi:hypothetical protein